MNLTTDIFLITYPKDYQWLPYLLESMRLVQGFRRLIVVVEEGDEPPMGELMNFGPHDWVVKKCRKYRGTDFPGYTGQAIEKLRAWSYTDADRILIVDSDCVFSRPVDLDTDPAISLVKPLVIWREWSDAGDAKCWHESTVKLLGGEKKAPYETMCRHSFVFPGWFLHWLWEHMGGEERLLRFKTLSDFNLMGNAAITCFPNEFKMAKFEGGHVPPGFLHQFWSHHTVAHPEVQQKLAEMGLL